MKVIGLIGEDPNDTVALENLLKPQFGSAIRFKTLCKKLKGDGLESFKFFKQITAETKIEKYDLLVCIRDLDGFNSDKLKVDSRNIWFQKVKDYANNCKAVILLNVWELEALLFADINLINRKYGTKLTFSKDPTSIKDPKEKLKRETSKGRRRYVESDCRELFAEIDYNKIMAKCIFFRDFVNVLKNELSIK
ncbi:DUF4276 family protein [Sphingobacterium sp. UBA5670]|uniref:DUF4276 family protein n=1 Tax=Sphingobacterium sp. UBA5670 TaxID=1947502 RepID=UPI0025FEDDEF|nr:DUF4276 family protein [Sphingobacterium sp. UBA5670]